MTAVVDSILGLSETSSAQEWLQHLQQFNADNQNELTFVDRFGEKKKTLLERLTSSVSNPPANWNPEVTTAALCVIRLCCREAYGLESVAAPEFVTTLFQISGLSPAPEGKSWTEGEQGEAAKGLVNLAMRDTAAFERAFLERNGMESIIKKLKSPETPKSMRFPFSRLVFLLALNESLSEKFNEQKAITVFTQILAESLADITNAENALHATEAMKAIFKLSMYLGPLSEECKIQGQARLPTPEQLEEFNALIPHLLVVLRLPYIPSHQPLKEAVVNCLINVPAACTELFPQEETLAALIEILTFQVNLDANPAAALTPILLVLTSIAGAIPRARAILKKVVFPHCDELAEAGISVEAPKANLDASTIGAKLIAHMTTFNVALKHYVNEFLFVLCEKDPNELVKMTGFGNAAGLLATHNLFQALSSGQATEVNMPNPKPPGKEELEREIQESVHGPDPSVKTGKPMGFLDSMTEEEQEAEAERLGMLIEKLEKQGVIKVLRKSDNDPDAGASSTSSGSS